MRMADSLIQELEQEAASTRRVLDRIPEAKLAWKPHAKSWSLGQLGLHVAQIPGSVAELARRSLTELPVFQQAQPATKREILDAHEKGIKAAKSALAGWSDQDMAQEWSMSVGGETKMALPRAGLLRAVMFNHLYHHRGQILVYLRLVGEAVPAVYGNSADENPLM